MRGQYDGHDDGRRRCTLNTKEFVNARVCAHCNLNCNLNGTLKFFRGAVLKTHFILFLIHNLLLKSSLLIEKLESINTCIL